MSTYRGPIIHAAKYINADHGGMHKSSGVMRTHRIHVQRDHGQCVQPGLKYLGEHDVEKHWELFAKNASETPEIRMRNTVGPRQR